jgi:hypothetical protein
MIHIDDICIASETLEQHLVDIDNVLKDLIKSNFMVAADKASFFRTETKFLGHIVSLNSIKIDENRKTLFKEVPLPHTKKEMMRFLGMANYLGSFCDSFILKAGPLFDSLKGRKREYTLTPEQIKAFEEVKEMIDMAPSLTIVDFQKPIILEVDAAHNGAGSILYHSTTRADGTEFREIIRFGSKRFSTQQCLMYTSLEKESLAILFGIQQHHFFLENSCDAIIRTDMKSLICILSCYNNPINHRMARVAHYLYSLPYRWQMTHIAGTDNIPADLISRSIPDYRCAFSYRLKSYNDLSRDAIRLPESWTKTPNVVLTTKDIMNNLKNNMLSEIVSDRVMEKRIKQFTLLAEEILGTEYQPSLDIVERLEEIESNNKLRRAEKRAQDVIRVDAMRKIKTYPVTLSYLITTKFLNDQQNENEEFLAIKMMLRTSDKTNVPKKVLHDYRLLNDTVLVSRASKKMPFEDTCENV